MKKTILIAYIPVLHRGYVELFEKYRGTASALYILGLDFHERFPQLKKDIRALDPWMVRVQIESLGFFPVVGVLTTNGLRHLDKQDLCVVMPDEDICNDLVGDLQGCEIQFHQTFLRWDNKTTLSQNEIDDVSIISSDDFHRKIISKTEQVANKSSDWWRQVGAAIVTRNGMEIVGYNSHLPTEYSPYIHGDPRSNFRKGIHIELSTAVHAEPSVIGCAVRHGIPTENASIYVSTFPCPPCANLIACCGFEKLYFKDGYSMLNGVEILRSAGMEIIRVK